MHFYNNKPSVTTVLHICGYYSQMSFATKTDKEFGTLIHNDIQCILNHKKPSGTTLSNLYIKSFLEWMGDNKEIVAVEAECEGKRTAGRIDLVLRIKNKLWIIDLKTSSTDCRAYQLQTSAYQVLWNYQHKDKNMQAKKRGILLLNEKRAKLIVHSNPMDSYVFQSCLNVADDLLSHKIIKKENLNG